MSRNVIAGGAAQRAIAGLMSLALVSGGLVVPSVANAAEETGKAVCNSEGVAPKPRGNAPKGVTLDRDVYKIGDVVEIKITGLTDIMANHKLRLTLNGAQWPADQSAGDGLERVGESPVLDIPTSKIENGEVTVKAVLPSEFEGLFRSGKNILIAQLDDGTKVTGVRGVEIWVNESGKAAGACGPENPKGDKPEPKDGNEPESNDKPARDDQGTGSDNNDQGGKDQDTNPSDDNQGNTEQPGDKDQSVGQDNKGEEQPANPDSQDSKDPNNPVEQGDKNQPGDAQSDNGQGGKPADQNPPADQGNKDQSGDKPSEQDGNADNNEQGSVEKPADQGGNPAGQSDKGQSDQSNPADQDGNDKSDKEQGTKPGKDQSGDKPVGQSDKGKDDKPADQGNQNQDAKPADQGDKNQPGADQGSKPGDNVQAGVENPAGQNDKVSLTRGRMIRPLAKTTKTRVLSHLTRKIQTRTSLAISHLISPTKIKVSLLTKAIMTSLARTK